MWSLLAMPGGVNWTPGTLDSAGNWIQPWRAGIMLIRGWGGRRRFPFAPERGWVVLRPAALPENKNCSIAAVHPQVVGARRSRRFRSCPSDAAISSRSWPAPGECLRSGSTLVCWSRLAPWKTRLESAPLSAARTTFRNPVGFLTRGLRGRQHTGQLRGFPSYFTRFSAGAGRACASS